MSNSKISALTSATTPVAGTETLPIVQSGVTKQVSIANLTAGRAVAGLSFTANSRTVLGSGGWWDNAVSGNNVGMTSGGAKITPSDGSGSATNNACDFGSTTSQWKTIYTGTSFIVNNRTVYGSGGWYDNTANGNNNGMFSGGGYIGPSDGAGNAVNNSIDFGSSTYAWKDIYFAGNLIPKTAAKGINFTANTAATGMTSQLLNWYEEGTWTPTVKGGTTAGTYQIGTNGCTYTRIGRQVTLNVYIQMAGTVTGGGSGDLQITGVPYAKAANANPVAAVYLALGTFTGNAPTASWNSFSSSSILILNQVASGGYGTTIPISYASANAYIAFTMVYFV